MQVAGGFSKPVYFLLPKGLFSPQAPVVSNDRELSTDVSLARLIYDNDMGKVHKRMNHGCVQSEIIRRQKNYRQSITVKCAAVAFYDVSGCSSTHFH